MNLALHKSKSKELNKTESSNLKSCIAAIFNSLYVKLFYISHIHAEEKEQAIWRG